jgi:hypothetical protein
MVKTKKIKKILRESKFSKQQLSTWRRLNRERNNRGICERCFSEVIKMLEEINEIKGEQK